MDARAKMRNEVARYFDLQGVRLRPEELQILYDYVTDLTSFTCKELSTVTEETQQGSMGSYQRRMWNAYRFLPDGSVQRNYTFRDSDGGRGKREEHLTAPREVVAVLRQIAEPGAVLRVVAPPPEPEPAPAPAEEPAAPVAATVSEFGAEQIAALRTRLQLTQKQLADRLGTFQTSVSLWESGKTKPSRKYQERLQELSKTEE